MARKHTAEMMAKRRRFAGALAVFAGSAALLVPAAASAAGLGDWVGNWSGGLSTVPQSVVNIMFAVGVGAASLSGWQLWQAREAGGTVLSDVFKAVAGIGIGGALMSTPYLAQKAQQHNVGTDSVVAPTIGTMPTLSR